MADEREDQTSARSQPCAETGPDSPSSPEALRAGGETVSWSFEYRNYSNREWRASVFNVYLDGCVPTTRDEAWATLERKLPGWAPGTQLRLVETTRSTAVYPPIGVFSPDRPATEGALASAHGEA